MRVNLLSAYDLKEWIKDIDDDYLIGVEYTIIETGETASLIARDMSMNAISDIVIYKDTLYKDIP